MKILVTGAAGFLGSRLIGRLLSPMDGAPPADQIVAVDTAPCPVQDVRVHQRVGSVADPGFMASVLERDVEIVCHLAAVLSGQSEAEFDLGMQVNLDATRGLLERSRSLGSTPRVVFTSTVAVFGTPFPETVPEDMSPRPHTSYGTEKAMCELLVGEYSRRGFIDGISVRVPTVAIRPGRPNSALSSFVSGIVREPVNGLEATCPVPADTRLWITSPEVITRNLVHATRIPAAALNGRRTVNLPGITVTPAEMLDSLERLVGAQARQRVRYERDAHIEAVVRTWPGAIDSRRAIELGFEADADVDAVVRQFLAEPRA